MSSNTLRFHKRVQALQISKRQNGSSSSNRKQRGPSHALQGDAKSQRNSTRGTTAFRHSQVQNLRKKGAAAEVHVLPHDLPEVVIAQDYPLDPAPESAPQEPPSYEPMAHEYGAQGGGWVDSDDEVEDEVEETEVEKTARKVRVEYRDFRTRRRDRTDKSNKHWEQQMSGMIDAYADWCHRNTTGASLPPCDKPPLWIDVIDVFGTFVFCICLTDSDLQPIRY